MARYCPGFEAEPMLDVAELIKNKCFLDDSSLFSEKSLWTMDNIQSVKDLFLENLEKGSGKYLEKMERQLQDATPSPVSYTHLTLPTIYSV